MSPAERLHRASHARQQQQQHGQQPQQHEPTGPALADIADDDLYAGTSRRHALADVSKQTTIDLSGSPAGTAQDVACGDDADQQHHDMPGHLEDVRVTERVDDGGVCRDLAEAFTSAAGSGREDECRQAPKPALVLPGVSADHSSQVGAVTGQYVAGDEQLLPGAGRTELQPLKRPRLQQELAEVHGQQSLRQLQEQPQPTKQQQQQQPQQLGGYADAAHAADIDWPVPALAPWPAHIHRMQAVTTFVHAVLDVIESSGVTLSSRQRAQLNCRVLPKCNLAQDYQTLQQACAQADRGKLVKLLYAYLGQVTSCSAA
eukprot:jgi/Chrzof1/14446/Cz09g03080.t1